MSEAEFCCDEGAELAYQDMLVEDAKEIDYDRLCRLRNMYGLRNVHGKYVIVRQGTKPKKTLYLQDRNISKKCFWTQYHENALVFDSEQAAQKIAKNLKYGDPYVRHMKGSVKIKLMG